MIHFWGIVTTCRILNRIESMEFVPLYSWFGRVVISRRSDQEGVFLSKKAKDRDPVQTCD